MGYIGFIYVQTFAFTCCHRVQLSVCRMWHQCAVAVTLKCVVIILEFVADN